MLGAVTPAMKTSQLEPRHLGPQQLELTGDTRVNQGDSGDTGVILWVAWAYPGGILGGDSRGALGEFSRGLPGGLPHKDLPPWYTLEGLGVAKPPRVRNEEPLAMRNPLRTAALGAGSASGLAAGGM